MSENPHKRLIAWQKAMDAVEEVYRLTERFPSEERFGLVSQMRRASVSIATNIAEGAARQTAKERLQFFFISRGSLSELDTQLEIAERLDFIQHEQRATTLQGLEEIGRLLNGLITSQRMRSDRAVTAHLLTGSLTH